MNKLITQVEELKALLKEALPLVVMGGGRVVAEKIRQACPELRPQTIPNKYRKLPVVIDAVQWDGREQTLSSAVFALCPPEKLPQPPDDPHINPGYGFTPADGKLYIPTLEGVMCANPGDWIIKGVKGEVYPCKPDIFQQTYELHKPESEK